MTKLDQIFQRMKTEIEENELPLDLQDDGPPEPTPQDKAKQARLNKLARVFGSRFVNADFDNYNVYAGQPQELALRACKGYAQKLAAGEMDTQKKNSLVLVGRSGTGKNHLAYAIARKAITVGQEVSVVSVIELMRKIKEAWQFKEARESDIIKEYSTVDLLILEEVGVQYGTENEKIVLWDIINNRYRNCKPLILLSNLGQEEFAEYVDFEGKVRIMDRLNQMAAIIPFDWQSYREITDRGEAQGQSS